MAEISQFQHLILFKKNLNTKISELLSKQDIQKFKKQLEEFEIKITKKSQEKAITKTPEKKPKVIKKPKSDPVRNYKKIIFTILGLLFLILGFQSILFGRIFELEAEKDSI